MTETRHIKVLLIDDSEADRCLFREYLESVSPQYEVHDAATATNGLRLASIVHPDCVLLDLRLNGEYGYEVLVQLVGLERPPKIPVIILTEMGGNTLETGAKSLGACDFLVKRHADPGTLDIAIRRAIDQSHGSNAPS